MVRSLANRTFQPRLLLGGRQAAPGRAGDRRGRGRLGRRGRQGGE